MEVNAILTEFDIGSLLAQHPDTVKVALTTPKRFIKGLEEIGFSEKTAVSILGKIVYTVKTITDEHVESEPE